jgi:hypothetical protein
VLTQKAHVLTYAAWHDSAEKHDARVKPWVIPRLQRRKLGLRHPVDDFLFDYYNYRPAQLRMWHPGHRYRLAGPTGRYRDHADYTLIDGTAQVAHSRLTRRLRKLRRALLILESTSSRPASFGCFGMHEWAMVYGLEQPEVRHEQLPLRLPPAEIVEVVNSVGLRCTHFDAYRFFTPEAASRQAPMTRDSQPLHEQPGCLHAGMDLYRFSYEAGPFIPSTLVADSFENARRSRTLDMQASPYDLSSFGIEPIQVETPGGKAKYVARQQELADESARLRTQLLQELNELLDWATRGGLG